MKADDFGWEVYALRRTVVTLLASVSLLALSGCHGLVLAPRGPGPVVVNRPGPPPHAPAHGYRYKHPGGAELRFDTGLGVYVVVGYPEIYFYDGWFVRYDGGAWQVSASLDGDWESRPSGWLPPGLKDKYAGKPKPPHPHKTKKANKGRGGGPRPAKGGW